MQHTTIAVDLAKSVFQVAVSHHPGRVDEEHRLSRARLLAFFADRPAATVLLEACGSAHYWGRAIERLGHPVRLLSPHESRVTISSELISGGLPRPGWHTGQTGAGTCRQKAGHQGRTFDWHPRARISIVARNTQRSTEGPKLRLQSDHRVVFNA